MFHPIFGYWGVVENEYEGLASHNRVPKQRLDHNTSVVCNDCVFLHDFNLFPELAKSGVPDLHR